jgi:hypothetical protein
MAALPNTGMVFTNNLNDRIMMNGVLSVGRAEQLEAGSVTGQCSAELLDAGSVTGQCSAEQLEAGSVTGQ